MATIFVNGCFDLLHEGHKRFLTAAKGLGYRGGFHISEWEQTVIYNRLIVAINSDEYARKLKADKWGPGYPKDDERTRAMKLRHYADEVYIFESEDMLKALIDAHSPCILCKGPDYAGKRVTGDDIAPVLILDTPETEEVRQFKEKAYARPKC